MTQGDTLHPENGDARPVVGRTVSNRGPWLFAGIIAAVAIGLFGALEARRQAVTSPSVLAPTGAQSGVISAPPELAIPSDFADTQQLPPPVAVAQPALVPVPQMRLEPSRPRLQSAYSPALPSYNGPIAGQAPLSPAMPASVYQAPASKAAVAPGEGDTAKAGRVSATRFVSPATTVPQGAVIQAVLETALDSNRPGFARAVVTRDVFSFDGSRVLIQRGSKLFGEYKADLATGQNRALIQWHRLTRPDGVIIDIDSPSADPLGRAGVKGKVNSHFLARFSGAILQSFLDVGVQLAARKATGDTIILGLPGSVPQVTVTKPDDVKPTLTVKEGTSVSVFVVHDLDFTEVER